MKITILKEKKQKKQIDEGLPLAGLATLIGGAISDALDDEPAETADNIIDKSGNKPVMVQAHGDEFRSIKRILQAIQAQLIKMGGGPTGKRSSKAAPAAAGVVSEEKID